jgi:hypothetical protein
MIDPAHRPSVGAVVRKTIKRIAHALDMSYDQPTAKQDVEESAQHRLIVERWRQRLTEEKPASPADPRKDDGQA